MPEELAENQPAFLSNVELRPLTIEEVRQYEAQIKASFCGALPEKHQTVRAVEQLWKCFLARQVQIWGMFADFADGKRKLFGIMTSMINELPVFDERCFFIFTFYKLPDTPVSIESWVNAFAAVRAWAKERNCTYMEALSGVPEMIAIAEAVGFDSTVRRLAMEV